MSRHRQRASPPREVRRWRAPGRVRAALAVLALALAARASALGLERTGEIVALGGETGLLAPAALWYDGVRDLLAVACPNVNRVLLLDRQGRVVSEIGKGGEIPFPRAVAATRDGTLWVASRDREALVAYGRYFAGSSAEPPRTVPLTPFRGGAPIRPTAVFADDDGKVYVGDRGNRQVLVLDAEGKLEATLRDVGEPADLWVERGTVYVAEPAFGGIRVYDRKGRLARTLGIAPAQFREPIRPKAIAVDRSGRLWVLEEGSRGIKALDPVGNLLLSVPGDGLFAPADLAIDPRGTLYVLEEGGNRIAVFRISGA